EAHVRDLGAALMGRLEQLADEYSEVFGAPRGMGLLLGLPLQPPHDVASFVNALRERGILVGSAGGNTLRFAPPLIATLAHVDRVISALRVCAGSA
ncbi:MAG TPA: aminotransferase class III-fold pyridoxal phosphate-dependent enzyme, partial [Candidatus Baltobacteraceae bacterium]|nr:aminotransferase class III-fold pyridoxal phosphate-dependent enzyme [Candidatus Baltobacteraceae bacterium]